MFVRMIYLWISVANIFLYGYPDLQTRLPALEDEILKEVDRVKAYENKELVEVVHPSTTSLHNIAIISIICCLCYCGASGSALAEISS